MHHKQCIIHIKSKYHYQENDITYWIIDKNIHVSEDVKPWTYRIGKQVFDCDYKLIVSISIVVSHMSVGAIKY